MVESWTTVRIKLAKYICEHPEDEEGIERLRRELKNAPVDPAVVEAVESAPELTSEQRARLALLLNGDTT